MRFSKFVGALAGAAVAGALLAPPANAQTAKQESAQEVPKPQPPKAKAKEGPSLEIGTWRFFYDNVFYFENAQGLNFALVPGTKLSYNPYLGGTSRRNNIGAEFIAPSTQIKLGLSLGERETDAENGEDTRFRWGVVTPNSFPSTQSSSIDAKFATKNRDLGHGIGLVLGGQAKKDFNRPTMRFPYSELQVPDRSRYEIDAGLLKGQLNRDYLMLLLGMNLQNTVTSSKRDVFAFIFPTKAGEIIADYQLLGREDTESRRWAPALSLTGSKYLLSDKIGGIRVDGKFAVEFPSDRLLLDTSMLRFTISFTPTSPREITELLERNTSYNGEVRLYQIFGDMRRGWHVAYVTTAGYMSGSYSTINITPGAQPTGTTRNSSFRLGMGASVRF